MSIHLPPETDRKSNNRATCSGCLLWTVLTAFILAAAWYVVEGLN